MKDYWYIKKTWTKTDKEDFLARLNRSRTMAPQYARIQASTLLNLNDLALIPDAIEILEMVKTKWPNHFDLSMTYNELAKCQEKLSNISKAVEYYLLALKREEEKPHLISPATFNFSLLVAKNKLKEYYAEVDSLLTKILTKRSKTIAFPRERFIAFTVFALINSDIGEKDRAKMFAEKALFEAERKESGFSRHPKVGLVGENDTYFIDLLKKLIR